MYESFSGDEQRVRILVVDDNQALASLLKVMLEDENEVMLAQDSHEGYFTYLSFRPDLIITDIQMPGRNGLEMMETIRGHNPEVRAIYISGSLEQFQSHLKVEMTRYRVGILQKPFSRNELIKLLSQV